MPKIMFQKDNLEMNKVKEVEEFTEQKVEEEKRKSKEIEKQAEEQKKKNERDNKYKIEARALFNDIRKYYDPEELGN